MPKTKHKASQLSEIQSLIKQARYKLALQKIFAFILNFGIATNQIKAIIPLLIEKINSEINYELSNHSNGSIASPNYYSTAIEEGLLKGDMDLIINSSKILGLIDNSDTTLIPTLNILYTSKLFPEISEILEFLISLGFDSKHRFMMLAETYIQLGKRDKAKVILVDLMRDENSALAKLKYCELLEEEKNFQELKQILNTIHDYDKRLDERFKYLRAVSDQAHFQYATAEVELEKLYNKSQNDLDLLNAYCSVLYDLGDIPKAVSLYKSYLGRYCDVPNATVYNNLGVMLLANGEINESADLFQRACDLDGKYAAAFRNLSFVAPEKIKHARLSKLSSDTQNNNLESKIDINITKYRVNEKHKKYEIAFKNLKTANDLQRQKYAYSFSRDEEIFDRIEMSELLVPLETLNPIEIKKNELKPIFIVGLPRSGTSLMAQVLSAHDAVTNLGELPYLNYLLFEKCENIRLSQTKLRNVKEEYFRLVKNHKSLKTNIFIDKTPLNFVWINWIKLIFPEAIIINMERDWKELFWSNYSNFFNGERNSFTCDLVDIKMFHERYIRHMKRNSHVFSSVNLDEFRSDIRVKVEPILEVLKLSWCDQIYSFHDTKSVVKTASAAQVRSNINRRSSPNWGNYRDYLPDFF